MAKQFGLKSQRTEIQAKRVEIQATSARLSARRSSYIHIYIYIYIGQSVRWNELVELVMKKLALV